jgi:Aspartyl protease/PDZ domain
VSIVRHRLTVLILSSISVTAPAIHRPSDQVFGSQAAAGPGDSTYTIPFDLSGSTVLLPVRVNGSKPLWFILDSGANTCLLAKTLATELGIKPREESQGTGASAGSVQYWKLAEQDVSFTTESVAFSCPHLGAVDLSNQMPLLGHEVDGILGTDFFRRFVVEIDYDAQIVRLYGPSTFRYAGHGDSLPLTFERRLPYVTATIAVLSQSPQRRTLLVDTGSEDAVDDSVILLSAAPRQDVVGGIGLGQPYHVTLGRSETVQIGRFVLRDVPGVAPGVALIGGEVWRRFTVIFELTQQRLILEPNRHLSDGFLAFDPSGLTLRLIPDRGDLLVDEVYPETPAAAADVQAGDIITAVDGVPAADYGIRRVQHLFAGHNATYRLSITRGRKPLERVLRLSRGGT